MLPLDIKPHHLTIVQTILMKYVQEYDVYAFGSRVRLKARETSDLDIVILTTHCLDTLCVANLKEAFTESDLPFKVDVVDWAVTEPSFRKLMQNQWVQIQNKDNSKNGKAGSKSKNQRRIPHK